MIRIKCYDINVWFNMTETLSQHAYILLLFWFNAGNTESIKLLVKAGADVNAIDKDGLSGNDLSHN